MPTVEEVYAATQGPWHQGHAITCEVLGQYVTIVAGSADVAEAVALLVASHGPWLPPQPAMVGRIAKPVRRTIK